MPKQILAALNISETAADAEGAAVIVVNAMKSEITTLKASVATVEGERDGLKTKLEAAEQKITEGRKRDGEALFERAVAAGVAAPKDDEDKKIYIEAHEHENALGMKLLKDKVEAAETAIKEGKVIPLNQPIIKAGCGNPRPVAGEHAFETNAKALVTAKEAADLNEALEMVAAAEPQLYGEYLKSNLA